MKEQVYQDQSALALKLVLASGPVDPEQFGIFGQGEIRDGELTVRATVIGASHCLNIQVGDKHFTELFACVDFNCPYSHEVIERPWEKYFGLTMAEVSTSDIVYTNRTILSGMGVVQFDIDRIAKKAAQASGDRKIGLVCKFPPGENGQKPRTIVFVEWKPDTSRLLVETVHEYNNEGLAALTRSELVLTDIRKGG